MQAIAQPLAHPFLQPSAQLTVQPLVQPRFEHPAQFQVPYNPLPHPCIWSHATPYHIPSEVKNHCKSCLYSNTSIFTCRITSCRAFSESCSGMSRFGGHLGRSVDVAKVSSAGAQYS